MTQQPIVEVALPDGRKGIVERHENGRLKSLTLVDSVRTKGGQLIAGTRITERYEPVEGGLKITTTVGEATATATITRRTASSPTPATETARAAAAALEAAHAARQRNAVREAAEKVVQVMDRGGEQKAELVANAYDLAFGRGAATWFADRVSRASGGEGIQQ